MQNKKLNIEIDPLGKFPDALPARLAEACGILPHWGMNALATQETMKQTVCDSYQFPIIEMRGGDVSPEGVHTYPEDSDLYPYMKLTLGKETMFIYPHAIVAFIIPNGSISTETFITRMD